MLCLYFIPQLFNYSCDQTNLKLSEQVVETVLLLLVLYCAVVVILIPARYAQGPL